MSLTQGQQEKYLHSLFPDLSGLQEKKTHYYIT